MELTNLKIGHNLLYLKMKRKMLFINNYPFFWYIISDGQNPVTSVCPLLPHNMDMKYRTSYMVTPDIRSGIWYSVI